MPWFPLSHVNKRRPCSTFTSSRQRTQASLRLIEKFNLETIRSTNEISGLFSTGKRFSNRYATFIVHRLPEDNSNHEEHDPRGRVAFIAGKKHGNAVWRNSAKRRLREICRLNPIILERYDVLFIAKSNIMNADFHEVENACKITLNKIVAGRRTRTISS